MSSLKERAQLWTTLLGACCALVLGCSRPVEAARDTSAAAESRCPTVQPPAEEVCIQPPCAPSLCELRQKLKSELCAKTKVVLQETCADRVAITVSYGLGGYTFYYSLDSGKLLGSSRWNDQVEEYEAGDATHANCGEACVVCGSPNLPAASCDDATRSER